MVSIPTTGKSRSVSTLNEVGLSRLWCKNIKESQKITEPPSETILFRLRRQTVRTQAGRETGRQTGRDKAKRFSPSVGVVVFFFPRLQYSISICFILLSVYSIFLLSFGSF